MTNKTLYVRDEDVTLWDNAEAAAKRTKQSLSQLVAAALDHFLPTLTTATDWQFIEEYAIRLSGGDMQVRHENSDVEHIYPRAKWIKAQQRFGGKVYQRTVIVVDDWQEVPHGDE